MTEEIEIPLASTDKYEEALSKARFEYEKNPCASEGEKRLLEIIFPELAESNDEKIRKEIIEYLTVTREKDLAGHPERQRWIIYLEKQKEQKVSHKGLHKGSLRHVDNPTKWMKEDDMEREQKSTPIFKIGDKIKLKSEPQYPYREIVDIKDGAYYFDRLVHLPFEHQEDWEKEQQPSDSSADGKELLYVSNKSYHIGFRDGVASVKPAEWSEDENIRRGLMALISNWNYPQELFAPITKILAWLEKQKEQKPAVEQLDGTFNSYDMAKTFVEGQYYVMKHPERFGLCKPAEWSEEDETAYGDLIWCIEQAKKSAKDENDMGNIWFAENWVKNHIKSLYPQPHWKPSEEQMEALRIAYEI